jgi:hypothetical protein
MSPDELDAAAPVQSDPRSRPVLFPFGELMPTDHAVLALCKLRNRPIHATKGPFSMHGMGNDDFIGHTRMLNGCVARVVR